MPALTREPLPQLAISPVIHPRDGIADPNSRTFWSATANALYIRREEGADLFGPTPSVSAKLARGNDLVECGRRGPIGCDADAVEGLKLWEAADQAATADRPSSPVAHHLIGFMPFDTRESGWREMIYTFLDRIVVRQGMVADWALHALPDGRGSWMKSLTSTRHWQLRGHSVGPQAGPANGVGAPGSFLKAVPYGIQTILTDNGIQLAEQPRNRNTAWSRQMRFDIICEAHDIEHRLTKPNHPWTNGQFARMNRTIKEATVKRFHYESHEQLRTHLADFMTTYNFARRLKMLSGLTP